LDVGLIEWALWLGGGQWTPQKPGTGSHLLPTIKTRKLSYYGHVSKYMPIIRKTKVAWTKN